jgi:TPR repeat protein
MAEEKYPSGTVVIVNGLTSQPHLNGTHGTIKMWKEKLSRYLVVMKSGEKIACKADALTLPGDEKVQEKEVVTPPAAPEVPTVDVAAIAEATLAKSKGGEELGNRERCCICKMPLRLDDSFKHPLVCCATLMCHKCFMKDMQVPEMDCPNCKVIRPSSKAKEYVELVAQRVKDGYGWAFAQMADVYMQGHEGYGVQTDYEKGRSYLEKAVEKGHTTAMLNLAQMYLQKDKKMGVERDPLKAYGLLQQAAAKAVAPAIFALGQLHQAGDGVKQSWQDAVDFYKIASDQEYPPACFLLGLLLAQGKVLPQNLKAANHLWTIAARGGHKEAAAHLQKLNIMMKNQQQQNGESPLPSASGQKQGTGKFEEQQGIIEVTETTTSTGGITSVDKLQGVNPADLLSKDKCSTCDKLLSVDSAGWQPNVCCNTRSCMSCCIKFAQEKRDSCGQCNQKNGNRASPEYLQMVQKCCEDGEIWAVASMAEAYMFGHPSKLIEQSNEKAFEHLKRASDAGHTVSMTNLGAFYMDGTKGVAKDFAMAHSLYIKAARMGNNAAVYNLGQMHERGDGVQQSWKEAINLFNMAASKGYAPAQFALGIIFAKGEVVKQNFKLAKGVWSAAASQGFPAAVQALKQLAEVEAAMKVEKEAAAKLASAEQDEKDVNDLIQATEELETMD